MEQLKHECGVAMIRLLKPLEYYEKKYGTWMYGLNKLYLLMEKQHNRGQEGAGLACVKLEANPGEEYLFRERALGSGAITEIFENVQNNFKELTPEQLHDAAYAKRVLPFAGEVYMGHLRYSTTGKSGISYVHPFLRRNNWRAKNLALCGNFNMTNVDEIFARITAIGQHPRKYADTYIMLEQVGHRLDREVERVFNLAEAEGLTGMGITHYIEEHIDLANVLRTSSREWDGGYVICGLTGSGESFAIRDPWGIRPAFWYQDVIKTNGGNLSMNQTTKEILFLDPVCTDNIWGGTRLREDFHYPVEGNDLGECWGISAHPNGDGTLRDCGFSGMKLSELWKKHPEVFGNVDSDRFPLLIKIIDAKDDLSIQVHPDDDYAKVHENGSLGKTECWYILDCKENATIVIGHNAGTKEELSRMIHEGKWSEFIREIPIKKGDFLQIDPGTVHAIKGGTLILETQQNSDITYRVYDYDRLSNGKPRELHIDKSIDVITVPAKSVADSVKSVADLPVNTLNELYVCKYFHIYKIEVSGKMTFEQNAPFMNMTVTEGNGIVNGQPVKKGDHFILPNGFGNVELQGSMQIIASTI